jgi:hypothetical protein
MTVITSLAEWIALKQVYLPSIASLPIVKMGDDGDLVPPFIGIMEESSSDHETNGVILRGVTDYQITCELHTVPADDDNDGTSPEDERQMRRDLYDIIGDAGAITWMDWRNNSRIFDIRTVSPTTEASDGRRVSRWNLQIVACPS